VIGHAKPFGDGVIGLAVEEEGAQSEVAAVVGLRRLDKELAAGGVIHDRDSGLRVNFRTLAQIHGSPKQTSFQGWETARQARTPDFTQSNGHKTAWPLRKQEGRGDRQELEIDEKSPSRKLGASQDLAEILKKCFGIEGDLSYAEIGVKGSFVGGSAI
jgi:hypothetical protein